MITSFSRGGASAAIFAQMLYENGLVYTDPNTNQETVLIPPGTVGSVSAALIIDLVLTEVSGNLDFPPSVQNLNVVQAQDEYRSAFDGANYGADNQNIRPVVGNHGDAGDVYDNGLGGIYLGAYIKFLHNPGLNITPVNPSRTYKTSTPVYLHTETGYFYDIPTNPPGPRVTDSAGTPVMMVGNATKFTAYDGDFVIGGQGYSANIDIGALVLLPDSSASIMGGAPMITVNYGASLAFTDTFNHHVTPGAEPAIHLAQDSNLILQSPGAFEGTIFSFLPTDIIDLASIGTATSATLGSGNVLTVQGSDGSKLTLQLDPSQSYSSDSFAVVADGNGGTDVFIGAILISPSTMVPAPKPAPSVTPPAGIIVPSPSKALTTTTWRVGSSWNNPAAWTNGVPTVTTSAIVPSSVVTTITIDGTATAYYLSTYNAGLVTYQITNGTLGLETGSVIGRIVQLGGLVYLVSGTSSSSAINQIGGIIDIASGELDASYGGSIGGTVSGQGTFVTREGNFTLGSTAVIATPNWTVRTNSTLTLASDFAYAGDFTLSGLSITYLNGHTLALYGTGELSSQVVSAATENPTGRIAVEGTVDVKSLTLSGAVTLEDAKLVTQSGGLTLGKGATTLIDKLATWDITANSNTIAGPAPPGSINNAGLFEKTGGTGTADISVATNNTGSISVNSGEMEFLDGLNSTGTMTASGAILYVNNSLSGSGNIDIINKGTAEFRTPVASTFNAVFEDTTGRLQLDTPASFAGKIAGLQSGDFIDVTTGLTSDSYANGILTVSQTGFGVRGQLNIAGSFTTSSFHLSSDGHGGTNITV